MKKAETAKYDNLHKKNIRISQSGNTRQGKCSSETQKYNSLFQETPFQKKNNKRTISEDESNAIFFPPFPSELLKSSPEEFALPEEYIKSYLTKTAHPELILPSPNQDRSISFRKHSVSNSDLADTVAIDGVPSFLLKMSPENKDQNVLNARAVSPILLQKPAVARPLIYSRRMKSLNSSVRLKRSIPKQIPLVLDHEVMAKINENLPELTQICCSNWRKEGDNSLSLIKASYQNNDIFHTNEMSRLSSFESHSLKTSNGAILAAFCECGFLIVVQQHLVTFLSVTEEPNYAKFVEVPRNEISPSVNQIFISSTSIEATVCACLELVLVKHFPGEEQQLMVVLYKFNTLTGSCDTIRINLIKLSQCVSNIKMCPVEHLAFVACWYEDNNIFTQIFKYSLDEKLQVVLKSTELKAVNKCVNSLHSLKGCPKVILGEITSTITVWDLHSGHILKTVNYNGLVWSSYLWCDEDNGYLFSAVTLEKDIKLIAMNLTTGKFKVLRQYSPPEPFSKSSGLHVEHGLMTATYPEGFVIWELTSSKVLLKTVTDFQLFLSQDSIICAIPCKDSDGVFLRILDVTKLL